MIFLLFILTVLLQGFAMGCFAYCGSKMYRLPHLPPRWGLYVSLPFFYVAIYLLGILITAPFSPRPTSIVLWAAIIRLLLLSGLAGAIGVTTAFFFGWINGVGHKPEVKDNAE
jgi:hypothetical protein